MSIASPLGGLEPVVLQLVYPTKLATTAIALAVLESVSKLGKFFAGLSPPLDLYLMTLYLQYMISIRIDII